MTPLLLAAALFIGQFDFMDAGKPSPGSVMSLTDIPLQSSSNPFDLLSGDDPREANKPYWAQPRSLSKQTVLVYTSKGCTPCERMKSEVSGLALMPDLPPFDFVFIPEQGRHAAWVSTLPESKLSYPILDYNSKDGDWVYQTGWTDFETFYEKWKKGKAKVSTAPAAAVTSPKVIARTSGITYPLYSGTYPAYSPWPGDLREHMTSSNHRHSRASLDAMSDTDVIRLHDSEHGWYSSQAQVQEQPRQRRSLFGFRRG